GPPAPRGRVRDLPPPSDSSRTMSEGTRFADTGVDASNGRLAPWARMFVRYPSPRIIAAALAVVTVWRVALGSWSRTDLVVAGAVVVGAAVTEGGVHLVLLSLPPPPPPAPPPPPPLPPPPPRPP